MKRLAPMLCLAVVLLSGERVAQAAVAVADRAGDIAITFDFTQDAAKRPIMATTVFVEPDWGSVDRANTAHHELLHAIGFTIAYDRFAARVSTAEGVRQFKNAAGTVLAKLTPEGTSTHVDSGAGVVNGTDQKDSVMRPDQVKGQRMGGFEKAILDAAFDWSSLNINITPNYLNVFSDLQRAAVEDAVAAAMILFGSDKSGHQFEWHVMVTPVPGGIVLLLSATSGLLLLSRMRSGRGAG